VVEIFILNKKSKIEKKLKIVAVSGGFDPIHIGHIRMIKEARRLGDRLVVILNNDHWLLAKKGFVFMPQEERVEVLEAIESVDEVVLTEHEPDDLDRSVCAVLLKLRPNIFANGGDKKNVCEIPEAVVCEEYNIEMAFNVGKGGKIQSSSWLTASLKLPKKDFLKKRKS